MSDEDDDNNKGKPSFGGVFQKLKKRHNTTAHSNELLALKRGMSPDNKIKLLKGYLLQKRLEFADAIEDNDIEKAH